VEVKRKNEFENEYVYEYAMERPKQNGDPHQVRNAVFNCKTTPVLKYYWAFA